MKVNYRSPKHLDIYERTEGIDEGNSSSVLAAAEEVDKLVRYLGLMKLYSLFCVNTASVCRRSFSHVASLLDKCALCCF